MHKIGIIGGGASGFFAAIQAAKLAKEHNLACEIKLFESSPQFLAKVKISGGGRCNVTHHPYPVREFVTHYPRGKKELLSPYSIFQAEDTIEWFQSRGVKLKTEEDNRIFPTTNSSQSIIDCLLFEAKNLGVQLYLKNSVTSITKGNKSFVLEVKNKSNYEVDSLILSTGSSRIGYSLAKSLGHQITDLAPSLFSFKIKSSLLKGLEGTSFDKAKVSLSIGKFEETGPILITHWGLSGPAILKLSALSLIHI